MHYSRAYLNTCTTGYSSIGFPFLLGVPRGREITDSWFGVKVVKPRERLKIDAEKEKAIFYLFVFYLFLKPRRSQNVLKL